MSRNLPLLSSLILISALSLSAGEMNHDSLRSKALKSMQNGNWKDAYDAFEKLCYSPENTSHNIGMDLQNGIRCLQRINRYKDIDAFREKAVGIHNQNWRLLQSAAESCLRGNHYGYIVAGEFRRGHHRGGGRYVNSYERDRVRGLQLMEQALGLVKKGASAAEKSQLYFSFARMFLGNRGYRQSWRLQYLTDFTVLPDYNQHFSSSSSAPVDKDGNPVFHKLPGSWEKAESDGERWRWLLMQAMELGAGYRSSVFSILAEFSYQQFGVQTMAYYGRWFSRQSTDAKDRSSTWALHTLKEGETLARLAGGVKRFNLPDEYNYIKIWQEQKNYDRLASVFENRRQYDRAAQYWELYKPSNQAHAARRIDQILKPWGVFESTGSYPAGTGPRLNYRFRNGTRVSFIAHRINVKKLLDEIKAYIKLKPRNYEWNRINPAQIGYRLVHENQRSFLSGREAEWQLDLKPRARHFDRRVTVTTPLQKAGAYLVEAKMKDGNTSRIIVWVSDTVIVKKPLQDSHLVYVADAISGKPLEKTNVEFFGYRRRWNNRSTNTEIRQFAENTNADGQITVDKTLAPSNFQWLLIATTKEGRLAYLGFSGIWYGRYHDREYNQQKTYVITDRPVYRPKQKVQFKFWVRHAQYDKDDTSQFAGQLFRVGITNPKGEKIFEKPLKADEFGGFDSAFTLPAGATLGRYGIGIWQGNYLRQHGYFRVEEYKKPEFEVTIDAPDKPVMLGEKIAATIKAKYYFGSPVTGAKVKYKVLRYSHDSRWYPCMPWDWFYGKGYWWFAYDYTWYPGWHEWGCRRPVWWWYPERRTPPEVIAEASAEIGADGTVAVAFDTALTKEIHGDIDHRYEITAEVTDKSRRTIVGHGKVLVARKPFSVYAWVDRGYYRIGDTVKASFNAHTLDQKAVQGKGEVKLFRVSYKEGKPVETEVQKWSLDTDVEGLASLQIMASEAGQYRLSYRVTDLQQHVVEGAYIFVVRGQGFESSEFRFNNIEVIADKKEYAPGDKVRLMLNTNKSGGSVLLFIRPANSVYLPPKVLRLDGKSTVYEMTVTKKDMPNFFVEAVTIADGKVHTDTREIIVPPEKRVLNVQVQPSAKEYKPGEKASLLVKLTDFAGKPFKGSTVVTVYDKALEYISAGSNIGNIREFFWKWRRRHYARTEHSLSKYFGNLLKQHEVGMSYIGVFGYSVADDEGATPDGAPEEEAQLGAGRRKGRGIGGAVPCAPVATKSEAKEGLLMDAVRQEMPGDSPSLGETKAGGGAAAAAKVRKNFADTAYWNSSITTDADGIATVNFTMPENLSGWMIKCWGMGHGTKVGEGSAEVVTRKNLILRLQAPRFFVQKDEVVLTANVHNYLNSKKVVKVVLELDGDVLELIKGQQLMQTVTVEPNGEHLVNWRVAVREEGEAIVRMKALADVESDAMEMRFPVYVHGMNKMVPQCGVIRADAELAKLTIDVPKERRVNASRLEIRYSPTLAGAMVDALPYMIDMKYKTTEATLNRFVPTVVTQNILKRMGLDLADIQKKRTNLNAQEIGDDRKRATQWKRWERNPVFDNAEVDRMVKQGLMHLTAMQCSDGGWGWFSGYGERSYPHTTCVVVHGLQTAKKNGAAIVPGILTRGVGWLKNYQAKQIRLLKNALKKPLPHFYKTSADNLDALVYGVLVDADQSSNEMMEFLYRDRTKLSVYGKSVFGIALHKQKQQQKLDMIMKNIEQFLVMDKENQTAHLELGNDSYWWYWYGSEVEAHAYYLKLLARVAPKSNKTSWLAKYLLNNRKHSTYWNSTRDTALAIEAFADYIIASGEDKPDMTVQIMIDGKQMKEVKINRENLFSFDNKLVVFGDAVETGRHSIEIRRKGAGPLYFNLYLSYFTLEDYITKAGLEVKVQRKFYRLKKVDAKAHVAGARGQAVTQKVEKYERELLGDLSILKSGELVEVELEIDSKNDYEYLVFEDMKAAGFEAVEVRSGYNGNDMGAYVEFRDNRVVFLIRQLARGKHSVSYRLRAEIPGKFSALPARASGMYAPELRGNSDEIKLMVQD